MTCAACGKDNREGRKFCAKCGAPLALQCPACGAANEPDENFCGECGASLQGSGYGVQGSGPRIPEPRTPQPESRETRKVISVVFADLMGSTALQERMDPESVNRVMDAYYQAVRGPVEAAGGTVVQLLGDGVFCAFGIPQIAEDDALRAVRAAVGIQEAFREFLQAQQWLNVPIGLRVAVNTGEVVVSDEHPAGIGDPLNVAARLQQEACDGEVLIGQATRRLVAEAVTLERAGVFALKGRAETVTAYRVVSLERPKGATTAFVGRDEELARLTAVYEAAVAKPAAHLAVLLGSPGLGKSRLIDELGQRLGEAATVLTAHCDAAGGASFAPLAEALRELLIARDELPLLRGEDRGEVTADALASTIEAKAGASTADGSRPTTAVEGLSPHPNPLLEGEGEAERARIAAGISALLAGSPASPEETFFIIRRFLAALARQRPVVMVIDDLQWAEPLLLDLVEHLIQWGSGVSLLVLVGARPELRDRRSALATAGGFVSDVVTLSGLDAGAAMRLASNVIGAADLPAAVAAKVLATSEGNPLFVGELVRMLVDEGAIERQGDRWIVGANLAALEMPPTIHALLAARIERLQPDERTVLERAAVVGRHFSRSAVASLLGRNGGELDARLEALRRTELIEPDSGWFLGEPVLRFHHVLIRDAAYRRLLKGTRAELHERLANWIESKVGDAAEHDETIGWHLEQAHQHLRELAPIDAEGKALGERAAQRLSAAGRRALARDDVPVAADLLGRAIERLDAEDPARAELALDWCEALLSAGDVGAAAKAIEELGRFATSKGLGVYGVSGLRVTEGGDSSEEIPLRPPLKKGEASAPNPLRLRAWRTCFAGQLTVMTAPQELQATADAVAGAAEEFAQLGDAAGEAKAHSVHAQALARLGKVGACEAALDKALAAARKAGDRRRANAVLAGAPMAALWGPSPVTRASGRCLDVVRVLRITQGAPAVEAIALSCQGVLEALRGRTDAARRMIASSRKMVEELGIAHRLFEADVFAGRIDLLEGDAAAAEHTLRGAYDGLRDLGLGIDAARAGALLARALLLQDKVEEAENLTHESEQLAGDDLQAAIAWRGGRAEALAQRGEHHAAIELAQAAVAIAASTDALLDHADACLALAAALRAAGRGSEADAEQRRAIELWETKGATLLAERTRSRKEPAASRGREISRSRVGSTTQAVQRRVPSNAATAMQARFDAALAARDFEKVRSIFSEGFQEIYHPTGSSYGLDEAVASLQRLFRSHDPSYRVEPLASLGPSLLLSRRRLRASGMTTRRYDVGEYENEVIHLGEVDQDGRLCRSEVFGTDHLGDAITRLYERHAERLPDGPGRQRAAATARAVAAMLTRSTAHRLEDIMVPNLRAVDHRSLGSLSGPDLPSRWRAASDELIEDQTFQIDDVLALRPDGVLRRTTQSGKLRASGGAFETSSWALSVFGPDGRQTRFEIFAIGHEAEALARFDELTRAQPRAARRVRENSATARIVRFDEAVASRDADALAALLSDRFELVHHSTGLTYGRRGMLATWRSLFDAQRMAFRYEVIATLGDSLALHRHLVSAEGFVEAHLRAAGPAELEEICLTETGEDRLVLRFELFSPDRLGDAVARLYERYSEHVPDGRERCAATARVMGLVLLAAGGNVDDLAREIAPGFESVDHRPLRTWSQRGGDAFLEHIRALYDVADDIVMPVLDVLALEPRAVLVRRMHSGTERVGGGDYERPHLGIFVAGADGRLERYEIFDDEREAEALARFDELALNEGEKADVFANAATRLNERFVTACQDRDWEGLAGLHTPSHHYDDRRRLMQMRTPIDMSMAGFRVLFETPNSRFTVTPIATRGERLALSRAIFEGDAADGGGPLAIDYLAVDELDDSGRFAESVLFDPDDLDAAYDELVRRYWAGEGAAYPGHCSFMRAFGDAVASRDWTPVIARCVPNFVQEDHRSFAILGTTIGAEAWAHNFRTLTDLAPDSIYRVDHLRFVARGACAFGTWRGTHDGARFENPVLAVVELDDRGVCVRTDIYEPEQIEQVFARLQELASPAPPPCFANVATRTVDRAMAAFAAREWDAFAALMAPEVRVYDRTRMAQLEIDGREVLVSGPTRIFEMTTDLTEKQLLATRGERLALFRVLWRGAAGDVGPSEIDRCLMVEVNERGEHLAIVYYDPEDIDAAWAELDARYAAGEGAAYVFASALGRDFSAALAQRDWDTLASLFTPGVVANDYRLVGWGTRHGPAAFIEALRAMVELAPDVRSRADHVRMSSRGVLAHVTWIGTRDGGAFESPFVWVAEIDAQGKYRRLDFYDPHHLDAAVARFEEMAAGPSGPSKSSDIGVGGQGPGVGPQYPPAPESQPPQPLAAIAKPNAASVAMDRWQATFDIAFETGDWEPMRAICAPGLLFDDRRRLALLGGDLELMITSARVRVEMGARPQLRLIGTAGDRIAVARVLWSGGPSDGPFEIEYVGLFEVDEAGQHVAMILFDGDATRAAQREAWTRWAAIDPTVAEVTSALGEVIDSWNTKDAERLRAVFAEDLIVEDHRRTGTGRSEGRDAYVQSVVALWELAPESRFDAGWFWLAIAPHVAAYPARRSGKVPGGGEFESDFLVVAAVSQGRTTRVEVFEIDATEAALARFEELAGSPNDAECSCPPLPRPVLSPVEGGAQPPPNPLLGKEGEQARQPARDPLCIPPNAATRVLDRIRELLASGDTAALLTLAADDFVFHDRQRRSLVRGDVETWLRSLDFLVIESGGRIEGMLLATGGDRLALHHVRWHEGSGEARFEKENLRLTEVDEAGKMSALVLFDPEDRIRARTELFERYVASGADYAALAVIELGRAWNAHDLERMRALLPDDFHFDDRRRTGLGRVESAEAYVASVGAIYELTRDVGSELLYFASIAEHGCVWVTRRFGTNAEGGEFDTVFVSVGLLRSGRLAALEIFEPEDLDTALARFEELRPSVQKTLRRPNADPLRIPPNAVSDALDRIVSYLDAADWDAFRALCTKTVFEDRRHLFRTTGDCAQFLTNSRSIWESGMRPSRTLLATAGDRLALHRTFWRGMEAGDVMSEVETLDLFEVDEDGRIIAAIIFEPDDRVAASTELFERYAAKPADGASAGLFDITRAWNDHDLGRLRALLPDDFYLDDHRRTGVGRLEGADAYVASIAALYELSRDVRTETLYAVSIAKHGHVSIVRWSGTNEEGGEFDAVYVIVGVLREGRLAGMEIFELDDLDVALARFEELRLVQESGS